MSKLNGFHILCCTYGFWLPNEERGSCSDFVRTEALTKFGPANPVSHSRSVARKPYDFQIREMARSSLQYPPVVLTLDQIASVGRGFARELADFAATMVFACAILRDHFHLVTSPCRYDIRRFAGRLKGAATRQLREEGLDPMQKFVQEDGTIPSPWSVKPWVVYEFDDEDMVRGIKYANDNLIRARLPAQEYSFVVPYKGATRGAAHHR
jgi:REP element-mobilizing transposase RayT